MNGASKGRDGLDKIPETDVQPEAEKQPLRLGQEIRLRVEEIGSPGQPIKSSAEQYTERLISDLTQILEALERLAVPKDLDISQKNRLAGLILGGSDDVQLCESEVIAEALELLKKVKAVEENGAKEGSPCHIYKLMIKEPLTAFIETLEKVLDERKR